MEKASFARLNKLFEIDVAKQVYSVLLSNKNMLALIENPKLLIILVFSRLAHSSLVLDEHFMLKDLSSCKVVRLANSEAHQACLKEREKKTPGGDIEASSSYWSSVFQLRCPFFCSKEEKNYSLSCLKSEDSTSCLPFFIVGFIFFIIFVIFVLHQRTKSRG